MTKRKRATFTDESGAPLSALLKKIKSRTHDDCGCWVWCGGVAENGTPQMHRPTGVKDKRGHSGNQTLPVRRAIIEDIARGPLPGNYVSARLCETSLCVNPMHVMATTKANQARIAASRGAFSGPQKSAAVMAARRATLKFSDEVIAYVRSSDKPGMEVAAEVGMSQAYVSSLRRGQCRLPASPFAGLGAR